MIHPYKPQLYLLIGSHNGCFGEGTDGTNQFHSTIYDTRVWSYFGELVDSGYVIDRSALYLQDGYVSWILKEPLVDLSLPFGATSPLPTPGDVLLSGLHATAAPVLAGIASGAVCGDKVALNVLVDYWRERGARIGKREGNTVRFEDGVTYDIPAWENRFKAHPYEETLQ